MTTPADGPAVGEVTELLQAMIRNACVNDGTVESGQEIRNAELLVDYFDGCGLDLELFEAAPGRTSLVGRIAGRDPDAPSLCLNGHTDVVPVNAEGWSHDPFGGEIIDGEIWGRGAVDMLNLTASMAVSVRALAAKGFAPRGDLVFFAVADEESGSEYGARWMAEHHRDLITTDYVLTENGGLHAGGDDGRTVSVTIGEKGVAWRRITVRGVPGHGSTPYKRSNALMLAAAVITRIGEYRPAPQVHELWPGIVGSLGLDEQATAQLLDPGSIDEFLDQLPEAGARFLHACSHTTFSPNTAISQQKTNVIPDRVVLDIDIRTLPGEGPEEVEAHLRAALGDLYDRVDIEPLMNDRSSSSPVNTPLWTSLQKAIARPFPDAALLPRLSVGFTDARVHRDLGAIAYGAGLLSPDLSPGEFGSRFHGNDERIDIESLELTTQLWTDVVTDLLG